MIWGFPQNRGTILGVPIIRIIIYWGLYWGPPILRNYHLGFRVQVFGFQDSRVGRPQMQLLGALGLEKGRKGKGRAEQRRQEELSDEKRTDEERKGENHKRLQKTSWGLVGNKEIQHIPLFPSNPLSRARERRRRAGIEGKVTGNQVKLHG